MSRKSYHHGNLREALVSATLELIEAKGPMGFNLAEAARLAGVSRVDFWDLMGDYGLSIYNSGDDDDGL